MTDAATYPIREFARLTGVNPVTLRAWERRYGIITPMRTHKGHRFYTDDHIERVNNIRYWLDQGYPIRQVKLLLSKAAISSTAPEDNWQAQQQELMEQIAQLDNAQIDDLLNRGLASYPISVYYDSCLMPVLEHLRANHQQKMLTDAFTFILRRKLLTLIQQQSRHNDGPKLLMVPSHPDAELELLISGYALGSAGVKVEYFGVNMSPNDIQIISQIVPLSWIWLQMHPANADQRQPWLEYLNSVVLPHFVTGADIDSCPEQPAITRLPDSTANQVQLFIASLGENLCPD